MSGITNMGFKKNEYSRFTFRNKRKTKLDRNVAEQHAGLLRDTPLKNGWQMHINKGEDDEMEICGYKKSLFKSSITYFFMIATLGFIRLLFHWVPHWYLKATSTQCSVYEAEQILITEVYNDKHKTHYVKKLMVLTPESLQKLKDKENLLKGHASSKLPTLSVHFEHGIFRELDKLLMFLCKKVAYIWDVEKQEFVKLRGLDKGVSSEILHRSKGLSANEEFIRRQVFGANQIVVKESSILELLFLEVLNPFYIFQLFSFILWFSDNYYYYATAILLMSVFGITMTVIQTRKNQRNLKSTVHSLDVCTVVRPKPKTELGEGDSNNRTSEVVSTELLVPGDILQIPPHGCIMQCDALLLTGNCILNESMLTGESVPVTKTPFPNVPNLYYDPKEHARHTLFCGTQVIQTRYFGNEKVLAIVIRTGFATAKGGLVRSILYPPPVDFRFETDSYRFVALLAGISGIGFINTIITKVMRGIPAVEIFVEALDLITIVVPPALPAAMTVGRLYAQKRLKKDQIFCISPRTINVSGSIDCICFDKTGTLTEDGLDLQCVVPITNGYFGAPVKNVHMLPYNTFLCGLACCHSLTVIDKQLTGDPLDLKMFESTRWTVEEQDISDNTKFDMIYPTVVKPPLKNPEETDQLEIGIIREFPFSSSAQRMGVIIRKLGGQRFEYYAKGSPEMILNFVRPETVPDDFSDILETFTQEGYRVIALAHKELKLSYTKVQKVQREAIETELSLLGLIVMENRLKVHTTPCIQTLNDASIKIVMVTGDNILTAVSVARDCKIITPGQSVITVNVDGSAPPQLYYTLAATKGSASMQNDVSSLANSASIVSLETVESQTITEQHAVRPVPVYNNYRFAMTGKVWGIVRDFFPELIPKFITRGSVFARMSPEQKQQLVQELQTLGYYVAMCGDGANDCGALKAAHTGISLSEAESSVASPFTSKNPDITCVLNIIKEGRAALVTSFGIFKYMAAYSLCQFVSVMILYSIDSNLTDMEFLYIDLFIISAFAFFFGRTEAYSGKLVKQTPLNSLISFSPVLSLLLQMAIVIFFQVLAFEHVALLPGFEPFNYTAKDEKDAVGCQQNYAVFTASSFQYIILAIVFSKGPPYRQSVFSNYGFICTALFMTAFSVYLAVDPIQFLRDRFELVLPEGHEFRYILLGYAVANFVVSFLAEYVVVELLVFKKLRYKFHNVDKSKKKFLAIERDLSRDSKWPVLSSNVPSAASPMTPLPSCQAQIVVENEKMFDKNHVLHTLQTQSLEDGEGSPVFSAAGSQFSLENSPVFSNNNSSFSVCNNYETASELSPAFSTRTGVALRARNESLSNDECLKGSPNNVSSFNAYGQSPSFKLCKRQFGSNLEMNNFENR